MATIGGRDSGGNRLRIDPKWLIVSAIVFMLAGVGLAVLGEDIFRQWPLGTWSVDLDDLVTSIGALLIGAAAWRRANQAHDKADQNGNADDVLERREEADHVDHERRLRDLEGRWRDDDF